MAITQAQVEAGLQKAQDIHAVRNLANRIPYYLSNFRMKEFVKFFADDCTIAMPWGSYSGPDAAERCFVTDYGDRSDPEAMAALMGCAFIYEWGSEMLRFADDGETARGMWTSQGAETYGTFVHHKVHGNNCYWSFNKYGIDFKKVNGVWKIWHMSVFHLYRIPWNKSWKDSIPYQGFLLRETHINQFPLTQPFVWSLSCMQPHDQPTPPQAYATFADIAPGYSWEEHPHYGKKIKNGLAEPFDWDGLDD